MDGNGGNMDEKTVDEMNKIDYEEEMNKYRILATEHGEMVFRIQELLEKGEISGQDGFYLLNGYHVKIDNFTYTDSFYVRVEEETIIENTTYEKAETVFNEHYGHSRNVILGYDDEKEGVGYILKD